ncbi:MAG: hypothetical protein A3I07_02655 [Candidatus Doudnabacteria bacterium RIFCSPLOWO2_02_FULL_42_9]|uniref:Uncharacterized protein n=1 Tax=Candidatus Doudnabacteria bacterium RIFCSPHIGHO2_01_FULL_41_86 TaxID=1817821 RepID=A0A1F5N9I0_9BACT|nr:MAG: hypothetical protein A2717_02185 [Candidatus Doudnabacteria bacterium RIFCSPHIGHO2_01_FULL_41_86]OGE75570.1 MAG: hypothetical protein A3K07_01940 [Candidatus Doudnabacteria bacterium RIFCSPHIGHO2_01_43_10]OGE85366.1 MAG: hypothetical protein A3E28_01755 [Candidatus Doudnabacteria bacterium RIFCSPHIGHO2_12_FULL_42_22]OGE86904.1 MAG: hypothetical protein A3C49_02590 [Candidatus Doudnabacteria bacterium RIFCSPHIGHO2_02_FULL_42_25]OGE92503.1 MAG: hypothetical protein A2895_02745 [Candidatus
MNKYLAIVKKFLHPTLLLTTIFVVLLLLEVYLLYSKVYTNLYVSITGAPIEQNIVRLDVTNYNKMLDLLDSLKTYQGRPIDIESPFN